MVRLDLGVVWGCQGGRLWSDMGQVKLVAVRLGLSRVGTGYRWLNSVRVEYGQVEVGRVQLA